MFLRIACVMALTGLLVTPAQAEETTRRTETRGNRGPAASQSVAEKLQQTAHIEFGDAERIAFGELLDQIQQRHGLRVRLDRGTAMLMARTLQEGLVNPAEVASLWEATPGQSTAAHGPVSGIGLVPVTEPPAAYPPDTSVYQTPSGAPAGAFASAAVPATYATSSSSPVAPPVTPAAAVESAPPAPVQQLKAERPPEPATPLIEKEHRTNRPGNDRENGNVELDVHALGACEELFRSSKILTSTLRGDDMTVESLLRQALAQVGTLFDLEADMSVLPATYTHAYNWDLLVGADSVLITTRLQVNLRKVARVYRVPASSEFSADELAVVIRRTIRPWSWRDQIDDVIGRIEIDLPPGTPLPALPRITGIDLTGAGDLVQLAQASTQTEQPEKNTSGGGSLAGWHSIKALGSLISSGSIAAAHALINTTEMLHYADPPTATVEVLPGMLVISQSQGAHSEIADLLDQIEDAMQDPAAIPE
jgi:hypothetical protein